MKKISLNYWKLKGVYKGVAMSLICYLFMGLTNAFAAHYSLNTFNYTFCSATLPSAYTTANFSLVETSTSNTHGFYPSQTNKTMIIDLPAGFEFNTSFGTVTVSGTGVTVNSLVFNSVTRITVTLTTASTNGVLNNLNFNNFQIRATAYVSNKIVTRSGGTFKICSSTNNPSTVTSWGTLSSVQSYTYSSSTCSHPTTTPVYKGTSNNQILKIAVVISGSGGCTNKTITQFNFNTDGGNGTGSTSPSNDISSASVYYTESSSKFSTKRLFGTTANPNGAFSVNGSKALDKEGKTYYFWLTYDIKATATNNDKIDAAIVSLVIDGVTKADQTTKQPAGSRTISPSVFYSIANGNWNNTSIWSTTSGGGSCTCAPTAGSGYVYIANSKTVTLNGNYTVDYVDILNGGTVNDNGVNTLKITNDLNTFNSGKFNATSSWTTYGSINLTGTGTSTSTVAIIDSSNINVGSGTQLTITSGSFNVWGDLSVDGTLALGANNSFMNGSNTLIDGTGNITGSATIDFNTGNKLITTTANLTVQPIFKINGAITVENYGSITIQNDITGTIGTSAWINQLSSTLNTTGTILATGSLTATATSNTVNYSKSSAQNIYNTDYYHLQATNPTPATSSTKTFQVATHIYGDLTISGNSTLDVSASNYQLTLGGNWINSSANATTFNGRSGTLVFDDSTVVSGTATTSFYNVNITGKLYGHASNMIVGGSTFVVDGNFYGNGGTVTFNGNTTVSGLTDPAFNSIVINSAKTMVAPASEMYISGDFTNNGGTFTHSSGMVYFNGTAGQLINGSSASFTFNDVYVQKTAATLLATGGSVGTITLNELNLLSGDFTAPSTLTINDTLDIESGTTLTAGTTINSKMAWINNSGTFTPGSSTVNFNGTAGNQTIGGSAASQTFYNVIEAKNAGQLLSATGSTTAITTNDFTETTGNFTAPATFTVNGNASLAAGVFTEGTNTNFKGNLTNNGATFTTGTGTTTFNGTAGQIINGSWASPTFYHLVVTKTAGTLLNTAGSVTSLTTQNLSLNTGNFTPPATLTINGDMTLSAGPTFTAGATINAKGNWTNNGGTFTPGTGLVAFSVGASQQITGSAASQSFYQLTVNNAGGITLGLPVNVSNVLTLTTGIVTTTNTNILTLGSASTISGGSSTAYVEGPMTNTVAAASRTISFPIGSGGNYRKLILNVNHSNATSVTYTSELVNSSAKALNYTLPGTVNLVSGIRYWSISRQAVANFTNATIELFYNAASDFVTDQTKLNVVQDNGAGAWLDLGQGATSVTPSVTSISFGNPFHYFTLGNKSGGTNPLPISLLSFNVQQQDNIALTHWITESEKNNAFFNLQRSEDGRSFTDIAKVDGAGDSYTERNYQFADENFGDLASNTVYYRLKQTDFDGNFTISKPVAVKHNKRNITLYPNPGDGLFYLLSGINISQLMVYDSKGNIVESISPSFDSDSQLNTAKKMVIDITDKPAGIYMFSAYAGKDIVLSGKLVKDKNGPL